MNENLDPKEVFARLSAPFHPADIEWRAGAANSDKTKALALAYITSRAVMDRLDDVIGPENWRDEYAPGPDGGVICGLSLRVNGEWITKWDGAENTEFEAIKGGLSDAFKRAGYKWGIGRYLYKLESMWMPCEQRGKSMVLKSTPPLPSWALPSEWLRNSGATALERAPSSPSKPASQREEEILTKLGFGPKPEPETQPVHIAPVSPGPQVTKPDGNGNGAAARPECKPLAASNGSKRRLSWGMTQVATLVKNKIAANPSEAVRMLNEFELPADASPEQILAYFRK